MNVAVVVFADDEEVDVATCVLVGKATSLVSEDFVGGGDIW